MARVLRKLRKNTIRFQMYRYLGVILAAALIMNGTTIFFHILSTNQYEEMLGQFLALNQFYVRLKENNSNLDTYVQKGTEEDYQTVQKNCEKMASILERLAEKKVSKGFTRDILDVENLFSAYHVLVREIHQELSEMEDATVDSVKMNQILVKYSDVQKIYNFIEQEFKNLNLTLLEAADERKDDLHWQENLYLLGFLLILLIGILWCLDWGTHLAEQIAAPIQALTHCAQDIRDGKMQEFQKIPIEPCSVQEVEILIHVFHKMIRQLQDQIRVMEENSRTKLELQEKQMENLRITALLRTSELRALQTQMNPHFLFNTLNMISRTAYLGDSQKTAALLQNTAAMLHYSLDYVDKAVTLAMEIEMLGNYVNLQEQRFGDRICFDFDLDERFHDMQIPCLILQPLVENSIIHGVGSYLKDGWITIRTCYEEEEHRGVISIADNGVGMDEEKLKQVQEEVESGQYQYEKIGLANVYKRLQIFFSGQCRMEIYSIYQEGTQIRIYLPVGGKE